MSSYGKCDMLLGSVPARREGECPRTGNVIYYIKMQRDCYIGCSAAAWSPVRRVYIAGSFRRRVMLPQFPIYVFLSGARRVDIGIG